EPLQLVPGDRFIIRQFSPVVTIGGGEVLDAMPGRRSAALQRQLFLQELVSGDGVKALAARIARRGPNGATIAELVTETGWPPDEVEKLSRAAPNVTRVDDRVIASAAVEAATASVMGALNRFHKQNPLIAGMNREALRKESNLAPGVFNAIVARLAYDHKLEAGGEQVRLSGHGVVMNSDELAAKQRIEKAFASAGLKVPLLKDVMAALPVDRARGQKLLTLLLRDRVLVKLSDDLVFHRDALEALRSTLQQQKQRSAQINVADFKELTGVSRKYAIPLLEYLDRERVTRRVGDNRVIL
ncbi:MAG TPA: SelB C-terminal domain-containing protein, partial [Terriglobales bacterium]|nr:SelB C-terminal domain-containing protein [Terriglobales bacterium]